MSGVDNRIVTMKFDNRQFEQGAQQTLGTLGKIKQSMDFGKVVGGTVRGLGTITGALDKIGLKTPFSPMIKAANSGLAGVGSVMDRLGMKNPFASAVPGASQLAGAAGQASHSVGVLEGGVTAVSGKFLALTTIALTALSQITSRAVSAGLQFVKSFTFGPIMQGLEEYELNLKSIQTVQANTDQPLDKVNASLDQLNKYSDQTIYNFSEMARNVGTFTAAGVDLDTSVSSIKGIANLAALSGSSSEQAATAMYQLSQAIAAGKVGLMDWNSVVNAGMGGKKLQNALGQTAIAMGVLGKEQVKLVGPMGKLEIKGKSFRESIMAQPGEETWLSSDILVNTLSVMDGRFSAVALSEEKTKEGLQKYTKAQIAAKIETARHNLEVKNGVKYTDEQFKALQKMSTQAFKSATEVKTLRQTFDILKETLGSGWSATFRNIFGDLNQAKSTFTAMKDALSKPINDAALARNELFAKWNKRGGRDIAIDGIKNAWEGIVKLIKAVSRGFRDVFPRKTAGDLMEMSRSFRQFTEQLIPSKASLHDIRDIAGGVASVFHIVGQVVGGVVDGFKTLFDTAGAGEGSFLDFAGGIGEAVTNFDKFLEKSGIITTFFQTLGKILSIPLALLRGAGSVITGIFGGFDASAASKVGKAVSGVGEHLSGLQAIGVRIRNFFASLGDFFGNIGEHIGNALMGIGDAVANMMTPDTFDKSLSVINTGLLGAITLMIKSFFDRGVSVDVTGGMFDSIKETLGAATNALQRMQTSLKADILLKIAAAIGIMAVSLAILATIPGGKLTKALLAMGIGMGALSFAMSKLANIIGIMGAAKLPLIAAGMALVAGSILLLALALKVMSTISFGDMLRGLIGLGAMLYIIQKAMGPLTKNVSGMLRVSGSLILLGIALNLLATALKIFATMSWEEMAKGLIMLAGTLGILAGALKIMPDMKAEGIGLVLLGVAMNLLAVSMKIFATMSWEEMAKGLIMLAGSLGIIALAINMMPKTMMLQAAALVLVAGAMVILSGALKVMGSMGWEEIAKGLVTLAGALLILGVGLQLIGVVGTVGAVGLMLAAAALSVFLPVMLAFGAMDWMSILKSLTMLAGIFVVLGLAGAILAPVVPVILGLGLALLLMGAGLALAGVGALALATAIGILVAVGSAGIQLLVEALVEFIKKIPYMMTAFGRGLVNMVVAIAKKGPELTKAFGKILGNMLDAVIKNTPKIGKAIEALLTLAERIVKNAWPRWIQLGADFIVKLLQGLAKNMPRISMAGTNLIISFLRAMGRQVPRIVDAGYHMIIDIMNGISKAIDNNSEEMGRAGARLGLSIASGIAKGLGGAVGLIKDAATDAARQALHSAMDFLGVNSPSKVFRDEVGKPIPEGMALGIRQGTPMVTGEIKTLGKNALSKMSETMSGVQDAFAMDPNLNPTITPVLDLSALTQEANKMSSILATAPIIAGVSYQTAADISAMTQASSDTGDGPDDGTGGGGGGDHSTNLTLELHSPKPIDSVESYRAGKTLISLAKEALDS